MPEREGLEVKGWSCLQEKGLAQGILLQSVPNHLKVMLKMSVIVYEL